MAHEWNVESSAPQSSPQAGSCPSGTHGASLLGYVLAQDTHPSAEQMVHTLKESLPLLVTSEDRVPSLQGPCFPRPSAAACGLGSPLQRELTGSLSVAGVHFRATEKGGER